jgi:hypothetical protein
MCNTYCFSTATMITRTLLSVKLHVHCLSCFNVTRFFTYVRCTAAYTKIITNDELVIKLLEFWFKALLPNFPGPSQYNNKTWSVTSLQVENQTPYLLWWCMSPVLTTAILHELFLWRTLCQRGRGTSIARVWRAPACDCWRLNKF